MDPKAARMAVAGGVVLLLAACEAPITYEPGPTAQATEAATRPSFTVGDEFWYSTNRSSFVEVFEGEEDGSLLFSRGTRFETWVYSPDLALEQIRTPGGARETFIPDDGRLEFPLRVGKAWLREYRVFDAAGGPQVRRTRACRVMERGFATVPAGRFAVFRIACVQDQFGVVEPFDEEVFYAPEVGRIILRRTERRGDRERLLEYTRAAPP